MHPVEHQAGQRHLLLGQTPGEERGLAQRVRFGYGDHDEGCALRLQQLVRGVGAFPEAAEHGVKGVHEGLHVREQSRAEQLAQSAGHQAESAGQQLECAEAADLGRRRQNLDEPAVQEGAEPVRRVQEVQRGAARRGVDHDQVPLAVRVQLAQLLHRHVLLRAGEARGQRLVEGVRHDLLGAALVGVFEHDVVERALHVQHHRVQPAPGRCVDALDRTRGVVQLGQAQRLREPPCRVDGEHDDVPAALGGAQREGRGRGRSCRRRRSRSTR